LSVELDKECKNRGMRLKQHASFAEENGRIVINDQKLVDKRDACLHLLRQDLSSYSFI
jgi:hypothetical protein